MARARTVKINLEEFNRYLGDGVYASFDGYQIWLAVNHHQNKVVALDPQVAAAFFAYAGWLHDQLIERTKEVEKDDG
jgi:hypothetical protein